MPADDRNYWCLVSSRFWTWGIREHVVKHGEFEWSAPAELRRGDMVILYEMGKRPINGGFKGRMMFPVIGRAETDAFPNERWRYMARFSAIALQPPVTYEEVRDDPAIFEAWPALRGKLQSKLGNHVVPPEVWRLLIEHVERRDPGAAADVAALVRGDVPSPRGPERARILADDPFGPDVAPVLREKYVEDAFVGYLGNLGIGRIATSADGLPRRGGNGHRIPDHRAFCDLLIVLPGGWLAVVEAESEAGSDPKHGVNQVVGYRKQLIAAGIRAAPCVVAQSFTQAELDRASEHDVECFRVFIDPDSDFFEIESVGPDGHLTGLLRAEWHQEDGYAWFDLHDPDIAVQFGFLGADEEAWWPSVYFVAVWELQTQGWDVTPLIGRLSEASFEERYGSWMERVAEDFELEQTVGEDAQDALCEAMLDYMDAFDPKYVAPSVRSWQQEGAPYGLLYREVAERFAVPTHEDGTVSHGLYLAALVELQECGLDITPLAGNMTPDLFYETYCGWLDDLIDDFGLESAFPEDDVTA